MFASRPFASAPFSSLLGATSAPAGTTISCLVGGAVAAGLAASLAVVISAAPGNASASGATAAISVAGQQTIAATTGNASAAGVLATIRANRTVACSVGSAIAAGLTATAAGSQTGGAMSFTPSTARTIKVSAASQEFTGGAFWNLANKLRPVGKKDPDATIDITFDWADVLTDIADTISAVQFVLSGGIANAGSFAVGALATVFVSGGSTAEVGITCRITTTSTPPRIEDRTVYLTMGDQ